jgi:rhodanese-related sulfurtransferase
LNSIKIEQLLELNHPIIIDIRYTYDFNRGCIPSAINIPYYHLERNYSHYLNQIDIYYLYCDLGDRSQELSKYLTLKNYNTISIVGGYQAYQDFQKNNH